MGVGRLLDAVLEHADDLLLLELRVEPPLREGLGDVERVRERLGGEGLRRRHGGAVVVGRRRRRVVGLVELGEGLEALPQRGVGDVHRVARVDRRALQERVQLRDLVVAPRGQRPRLRARREGRVGLDERAVLVVAVVLAVDHEGLRVAVLEAQRRGPQPRDLGAEERVLRVRAEVEPREFFVGVALRLPVPAEHARPHEPRVEVALPLVGPLVVGRLARGGLEGRARGLARRGPLDVALGERPRVRRRRAACLGDLRLYRDSCRLLRVAGGDLGPLAPREGRRGVPLRVRKGHGRRRARLFRAPRAEGLLEAVRGQGDLAEGRAEDGRRRRRVAPERLVLGVGPLDAVLDAAPQPLQDLRGAAHAFECVGGGGGRLACAELLDELPELRELKSARRRSSPHQLLARSARLTLPQHLHRHHRRRRGSRSRSNKLPRPLVAAGARPCRRGPASPGATRRSATSSAPCGP